MTSTDATDWVALWAAIATTAVFFVYIVIAIFTIIMARATARSARISTEAFKEGQKYQEQATRHQELNAFLSLYSPLSSKLVSKEVSDMQYSMATIIANDNWFKTARENSGSIHSLGENNARIILDVWRYMESSSHQILYCYPLLSPQAKAAIIGLFSEYTEKYYPFYELNQAVIFRRRATAVPASCFAWLYGEIHDALEDRKLALEDSINITPTPKGEGKD